MNIKPSAKSWLTAAVLAERYSKPVEWFRQMAVQSRVRQALPKSRRPLNADDVRYCEEDVKVLLAALLEKRLSPTTDLKFSVKVELPIPQNHLDVKFEVIDSGDDDD